MELDNIIKRMSALLHDLAIEPVERYAAGLSGHERWVLCGLVATAGAIGFVLGRRRARSSTRTTAFGAEWRIRRFQNLGESQVSRVLLSRFSPPNYHLMNHVTLQMDDGTTQVDHILVSRFGVFVIETKDYNGWIFGDASGASWTQVHYQRKFRFQNPIHQNYRHVRAVQALLDFLPSEAVKSVVVFCGNAEFRTEMPAGVVEIDQLDEYLSRQTEVIMSQNRLQFCVGRLETARLAISGRTDVEHVESLARRHGSRGDRFQG